MTTEKTGPRTLLKPAIGPSFGKSLLLLWTGLLLAVAVLLFLATPIGLYEPPDGGRDPRAGSVLIVMGCFAFLCAAWRKRFVPNGLSGWTRVGFTALGTAGLLAVLWFYIWLATTDLPGAALAQRWFTQTNDLENLWSRWNAGISLVVGVWFCLVSYHAASTGRTRSPWQPPRHHGGTAAQIMARLA